MKYKESNNDFFSYYGTISRKNYLINMLILIALYVVISLVRFEAFTKFTSFDFLYNILFFIVHFFKFVILMSALSVVYRRIADISSSKSSKFKLSMQRFFVFIFVFPILYLYIIKYFFDIMPFILNILNLFVFFILMPISLISLLILCFIKGN